MNEAHFVLDASVTMTWCFVDETTAYTEAVLESLTHHSALAPALWLLEVGNVLVVAERRGRMDRAGSTRFIALLEQLPIHIEQEVTPRAWREIIALAREHQLSTYDATYLQMAMRHGIPLATLDSALQKAAQRVGVELYLA